MTRIRRNDFLIILILGALSTQIARDLGTTPAEISLSVSGYFIGLAILLLNQRRVLTLADGHLADET